MSRYLAGAASGSLDRRIRRLSLLHAAALGAGLLALWLCSSATAALPAECAQSGSTVTCTYTSGSSTFVVPAEVTSVDVKAVGGHGGDSCASGSSPSQCGYAGADDCPCGMGALVTGTLNVTPGDTLTAVVGGNASGATGGANGGGAGVSHQSGNSCVSGTAIGGGGGGASEVDLSDGSRAVVAGGGGGRGDEGFSCGLNQGFSYAGAGGNGGRNGFSGYSSHQVDSQGNPVSFPGAGAGGYSGSFTNVEGVGGAGGSGSADTEDGCPGSDGSSSGAGGAGGTGTGCNPGGGGGGGGVIGGGGGGGGDVYGPAADGVDPSFGMSPSGGGGGGGNKVPGGGHSSVDTTGVPEVVISYALPEPPSATITTPADGAYYAQGATVSADYSCAEGANGPGLLAGGAGCAGPVASGTALDTSATGQYCFTVTATSQDGLTGSQTNCYTVIQQVPTSLTSPTGLLPFQHGGTAKLSSTLTNADTGNPIEGKDVTMTLGSGADAQSCDGVTDPAGTASCTIDPVTVALGPQPITDSFAGDGADLASTNAEHGLVYGGINGGSFVIGDGSATGTVTFWGSQWSKVNHLSGGPAPAGFKGFENSSANIACGAGWTAGPGNSARPPQGPLPAYMAVIMTSKVGKAGALISGDALNVVVIQTAGGYASDPGHAGTGTVVARIC